ncbi:MAG: penicillin-binding protein [Cytophagales bacterium]|nr:MAG: penicillin-binding protein [Cytophagales bacterium]
MTVGQRKALKITGWTLLGLFLLGAIGAGYAYTKREELLRTAIDRATKKAKRDYQLDVKIGSAKFTGLSSLAISDVSIVPEQRDSLARLNRIDVGVRLWPLLYGQIALSDLTLENGMVQVVRRDTITNIDFALRRKKRDSTATTTTRRVDLADVAENLIDELLSKIPNNLNVRNLDLRLLDTKRDTTLRLSLLTEQAIIDDQDVSSTLRLNGNEATWHISGTADPADREYDLSLYADGKPLELKYLENRYNLKLQADTLHAELNDVDRSGGEFRLEGAGSVRNLRINHPAIARTDVLVDRAAMDANVFVGENYVGIDSSSVVYLGQVSARPFVKYTLSDASDRPGKVYEVQLHTDMLDAQALFNSFPQGLFESLEGMQVTGKLKYDAAFQLDEALPDSVKFSSGLTPDNFKIVRMGRVDLGKINNSFVYTPYEKDKPVRDIIIGPENPDFTPLSAISPDLRNAILTSEDYTFMTHKGFNEKAFRVSIATNFKEKKFKRGASTISMQLVKNVYLNRNKTLSRKVEEILIVWLIENGRLVPKERMYEAYLNLIEWGRNIYGISEAARYYFDKTPADLNLGESIFLAFVIPSPKRALNWFAPDGTLQVRNVRGYFKIIGRIMAKRGLTQPDSGAYGFYDVRLREGLRQQVAPIDSFQVDSLMTEPDEEGGGIDDFFKRLFNGKRDSDNEDDDDDKKSESVRPQTETGNAPANAAPGDTVKTRRQLRQERRDRKRKEREEKEKQEEGILN